MTYLWIFQKNLPTQIGKLTKLTIGKVTLNGSPEELVNTLLFQSALRITAGQRSLTIAKACVTAKKPC